MKTQELEVHNQRRRLLRQRMAKSHVDGVELAALIGLSPDHLYRVLTGTGAEHPCSLLTFQRALRAIGDLTRSRCPEHDDQENLPEE